MTQNEPAGNVPMRACAACRARLPSAELIRFALEGERVIVDLERRRGGRGVNLGPTRRCLDLALKRGAFQRGFRRPVKRQELEGLPESIRAAFAERLVSVCRGALRNGGARRVADVAAVSPPELRRLVAARADLDKSLQIAVIKRPWEPRIAWLASGLSEFTFDRAGGIGPRLRGQTPCFAARRSRSPSEKA